MRKLLLIIFLAISGLLFLSPKSEALAACNRNAPAIEIVPESRNRNGTRGEEKEYTIKVTNKDQGADCGRVRFALSKEQMPSSNWTGRFTDNILIIEKQKTKRTTFIAKSPMGASLNKKEITLAVKPENRAKKLFKIYYTVIASNPSGAPTPTTTTTTTPQPTTCKRVDPEMTITPDKTHVRNAGGVITYTIAVKNVDQGPCADRNMNLTRTLHNDNWKGTWDPDNKLENFKKGQTQRAKLVVTSPAGAGKRTYQVKINLRNNQNEVVYTKTVNFVISDVAPTPTPTPNPTPTPSPTSNPGASNLKIIIGADGIGVTKRVPVDGNLNPEPNYTVLNVKLYDASENTRALETDTTFTYDVEEKKLVGSVSIPASLHGNKAYNLFIIGDRYKYSQLPTSIKFSSVDKTIENENFNLIAGDVNKEGDSFNNLDLLDYHIIISCSIYAQNTDDCDANETYRYRSDLNFDGIVDENDYTLFLRELINQQGPIPPDF